MGNYVTEENRRKCISTFARERTNKNIFFKLKEDAIFNITCRRESLNGGP